MVLGLERCQEYKICYGWYPMYDIGLWTAWKGTSCTDWDCEWFGKVPRVWFGSWSVPDMQIANVDDLERYLVYRMGLWMVWKGARSMVWLLIVSVIESRV
jgi:hypothetical protein